MGLNPASTPYPGPSRDDSVTRFLFSRLVAAGGVVAVMSFVVFALIGLMPGDPFDAEISSNPDLAVSDMARLRQIYGVGIPLYERYWHWAAAALHGDLGFSRTQHLPVLRIVPVALGNTVILTGTAFVAATLIAVTLGTLAAVRPGGWLDRSVALLTHLSISIPTFWLGLMLIYLFAVKLGWLPASGMGQTGDGITSWLAHLVLPTLTLMLAEIGVPTRYVRAAMLEVLDHDYIRAAAARGLSPWRIVIKHALRNALVPVVTILAHGLGHLFSGALLTETIFAWRGMGELVFEAVMNNDYNLALVCLLFITSTVLVANIGADAAQSWLDPRIAMGGEGE